MPATAKNGASTTPPDAPNVNEIMDTLWEQVQGLREGKTTAANANAVSNAIGKMFTGVKLQMEYYRLTGQSPHIPFLLTTEK
jgi:hypothetical protein